MQRVVFCVTYLYLKDGTKMLFVVLYKLFTKGIPSQIQMEQSA